MINFSLGIYEKAMPDTMAIEDKMMYAKKVGYDFLELTIDQNPERQKRLDWTIEKRHEFCKFMHTNGITATTLSLSALRDYTLGSSDPECEKHGIDMLLKCIDLAYDIGARIILINGYDEFNFKSTKDTRKRFLKNLDYCTRYAALKGVIIGLENADKEFADNIRKTTAIVNEIGSPFLKVYADIGNAMNAAVKYEDDIISDITSGAGAIVAVHLKDTLPGEYRFIRYGDGHVDFSSCIDCLMNSGVGLYMAELFYREELDWKKEMKSTHDFLRGFFA
jgi:L-ribulose-5-phosphate 3-epimerase